MNFFSKLKKFFIDGYNDPRIPMGDKRKLVGLFFLALIPNIVVPEIGNDPFGIIYTLVVLAFIPDYFFNVLDQTMFLSLFPFDMKTYQSVKKFGQFIAMLAPSFISNFLWEYKKDVI